jgi:hypothetical protein
MQCHKPDAPYVSIGGLSRKENVKIRQIRQFSPALSHFRNGWGRSRGNKQAGERRSCQGMIPKSGSRFPAFAKPASAGEARSEKIMPQRKI